ncbi:MAG: tetratricopeptide repeat protein, partial [Rhodospirillales bacterium]|nr:tetratricopeptide repeat protein [Rhodospirillales bacterium]
MYQKSLAIEEALGRKEGMASDYANLGNLYKTRGDLERAEEMYQKSLHYFDEIGSPNAGMVRKWLEEL